MVAQGGQNVHGSQDAGIRIKEFGEIIVGGVFTTEHGMGFCHLGLDKGVPHPSAHRGAAVFGNHFRHCFRGNEVVNYGGLGVFLEITLGY